MSQKNYQPESSKQTDRSLKSTTRRKHETESTLYYKWGKVEISGPSTEVKWAMRFHYIIVFLAFIIVALLLILFFPKETLLSILLKYLKGWIFRLILLLVLVESALLFSG